MKLKIKVLIGLLLFFVCSCKKYLDKKPDITYAVPTSLKEMQAILDQIFQMNQSGNELIEIGSDDYYVLTSNYLSRTPAERLSYLWDPAAGSIDNFSWNNPYKVIYNANVVLDFLPTISYESKDSVQFKSIKGSALFFRAFHFYELAQIYCQPYAGHTKSGLGIALRLTAAIETKSTRATLQQTYDQIIKDLKEAAELLPISTPFPTRPKKAAAYGLLARTYLSMGDYVNAGQYANKCLQLTSTLMNFNSLTPGLIPHFNIETIYYNIATVNYGIYWGSNGKVDSLLYNSYVGNDLRKTVFYSLNSDGITYRFRGSYDGDYFNEVIFDGIATDEMYLIRAEAAARADDKNAALSDLNALLATRWKTNTFVPFTASTSAEALQLILNERRKELTHRGVRWTDIRRLNVQGANITLKRIINGTTYTLPPNDLRWAYLLPQYVIDHSELVQNPR